MTVRNLRRTVIALLIPGIFVGAGTAAIAPQHDDHHDNHAPAAKAPASAAAPHSDHKSEPKAAPKADPRTGHEAPARAVITDAESYIKRKPEATTKPKAERTDEPAPAISAASALKMLQEGNQRWVTDKEENPSTDPSRRAMVADKGQKPFATILTCADSRLPVERLFDRGVGELFVIRVAGNIAGVSETGTIEYGVEHLKTPLLVVMGHTKCGAVAAAASNAQLHGALGELVSAIAPAVERAKRNNPEADAKQIAPLAVKENVWQSITDLLRRSPDVREAVAKNEVRLVGAICDIATGKVEWMGEHPWQSELVEAFNSRNPGPSRAAQAPEAPAASSILPAKTAAADPHAHDEH